MLGRSVLLKELRSCWILGNTVPMVSTSTLQILGVSAVVIYAFVVPLGLHKGKQVLSVRKCKNRFRIYIVYQTSFCFTFPDVQTGTLVGCASSRAAAEQRTGGATAAAGVDIVLVFIFILVGAIGTSLLADCASCCRDIVGCVRKSSTWP